MSAVSETYPLARAVWRGDFKLTNVFLELGANIDQWSVNNGQTALMWAVKRRHMDIFTLLISRGAKTEILDKDGILQRNLNFRLFYK